MQAGRGATRNFHLCRRAFVAAPSLVVRPAPAAGDHLGLAADAAMGCAPLFGAQLQLATVPCHGVVVPAQTPRMHGVVAPDVATDFLWLLRSHL